MGHLQLEWVRSGLQLRACGRLSVEGILKQCSPPPPSQVSMKCRRRCIHFMHGSIWPVTIPPPPSGKSKITSLWFCKVHVFSHAVYTMAVACEQALLFGRAKQAPRQRTSEQRSHEESLLTGYDGCRPQDYLFLRKNAGVCGRVVEEE